MPRRRSPTPSRARFRPKRRSRSSCRTRRPRISPPRRSIAISSPDACSSSAWACNRNSRANLLWEIGYVGSRGDRLQRSRSLNQALLASATNPIRGVTTNTVANITQRKPYLGWSTSDLRAVEARRRDRIRRARDERDQALQQRSSVPRLVYVFQDDRLGRREHRSQRPGWRRRRQSERRSRHDAGPRASAGRTASSTSFIYELPWMKSGAGRERARCSAGGASRASPRFQSGRPLTFTGTNANNAFGFTSDRAQLAAGCGDDDLVLPGSDQGTPRPVLQHGLRRSRDSVADHRRRRPRHRLRQQRRRASSSDRASTTSISR